MYNLHTLGWSSFQQLCLTITREILGQTVEAFLDSGDGGRDGAFTGTWKPVGQEDLNGAFVIQCKHTSKRDYVLKTSDLTEEFDKATTLLKQGLCDSYVLITNARLTGTRNEEIKKLFGDIGVEHVAVFGATWIYQQIRESKRLRMLVPRVYGLGDLSQILDERTYDQAKVILESMREDLAKVVVTDAYRRAAEALDEFGFVLLIGEPAAGKTTIASLLAMAALDQWNAPMLKLDDPRKVVEHWNVHEPSQFFWLDDAFGVQQYEDYLVRRWNHVLSHIKSMLGRGARIVVTSRDYIYNSARRDLKESAFPLLNEAKVVIDVQALSCDEKRHILYNHLKLGKQPMSFRREIKPYLERIADHPRFVPETARRLAEPLFTKALFIDSYCLGRFVERREQILQEIVKGIDRHSKAALALIYMRNGTLVSPVVLETTEIDALQRLGSDLGGCVAALEALNGSLVLVSSDSGDSAWRFKHPTIGDAYAAILVQSPEHLGIFIRGTAAARLVHQTTCGDVGVEGAVNVPKSLFPLMLAKLQELPHSRDYKPPLLSIFSARDELQGYLAGRCSRQFLALYLAQHPEVLGQIAQPGLYLHAVSEVRLAERLHEVGLLPEETRRQFVETVSKYAIDGEDTHALGDVGIRSMFTDEEREDLLERVRCQLLPRLDDVRSHWEEEYQPDGSPEEYMQQLLDSFNTLGDAFADDPFAMRIIEREVDTVQEWIADNTPQEWERKPRTLGSVETRTLPRSARSIFDDIDAGDDEGGGDEGRGV